MIVFFAAATYIMSLFINHHVCAIREMMEEDRDATGAE